MGEPTKRARPLILLAVGIVAAAVWSGCAGDSGTSTDAVSSGPPPNPAGSATKAVSDYYSAIDAGAFGEAWQFLGSRQRREDQGYRTWKSGYTSTVRTRVTSARPKVLDPKTVAVFVLLRTRDEYSCDDRVLRTFGGPWVVDLSSGEPVLGEAEVSQIGRDLQLPSTCTAPPPPPPPPPPTTTEASCEPSYPGVCLDPSAYDYDCEGGGGNGPEYVQGPVTVVGSDPFGLDADGNGTGCEDY
jgi:hypothetical protein